VDCHLHAILEDLGGVVGSNDAGYAQLSGHDGRVTGHPALVGDDGRSSGHRWNHVWGGHLGDHDISLLDNVQAHVLMINADRTTCLPGAGPKSLDKDRP